MGRKRGGKRGKGSRGFRDLEINSHDECKKEKYMIIFNFPLCAYENGNENLFFIMMPFCFIISNRHRIL